MIQTVIDQKTPDSNGSNSKIERFCYKAISFFSFLRTCFLSWDYLSFEWSWYYYWFCCCLTDTLFSEPVCNWLYLCFETQDNLYYWLMPVKKAENDIFAHEKAFLLLALVRRKTISGLTSLQILEILNYLKYKDFVISGVKYVFGGFCFCCLTL